MNKKIIKMTAVLSVIAVSFIASNKAMAAKYNWYPGFFIGQTNPKNITWRKNIPVTRNNVFNNSDIRPVAYPDSDFSTSQSHFFLNFAYSSDSSGKDLSKFIEKNKQIIENDPEKDSWKIKSLDHSSFLSLPYILKNEKTGEIVPSKDYTILPRGDDGVVYTFKESGVWSNTQSGRKWYTKECIYELPSDILSYSPTPFDGSYITGFPVMIYGESQLYGPIYYPLEGYCQKGETKSVYDTISSTKLITVTDADNLQSEVDKITDELLKDKTQESINELNLILEKAKSILNKYDTPQKDIDQATNDLRKAIENLKIKPVEIKDIPEDNAKELEQKPTAPTTGFQKTIDSGIVLLASILGLLTALTINKVRR